MFTPIMLRIVRRSMRTVCEPPNDYVLQKITTLPIWFRFVILIMPIVLIAAGIALWFGIFYLVHDNSTALFWFVMICVAMLTIVVEDVVLTLMLRWYLPKPAGNREPRKHANTSSS